MLGLAHFNLLHAQSAPLRVTNTSLSRSEFRAYAIDPSCGMTMVTNWFAADGPNPPCSGISSINIPPVANSSWVWYRVELSKAGHPVPNSCSATTPNVSEWMFIDSPYTSCTTLYPSSFGVPNTCNLACDGMAIYPLQASWTSPVDVIITQ